jgi:hypothetical protein
MLNGLENNYHWHAHSQYHQSGEFGCYQVPGVKIL